MSLTLLEGPAGSGKTTRLFQAVAEHLVAHPLQPNQQVLALTKMHGSRRRMLGKLAEVGCGGRLASCATLNSFALGLVRRWRSLGRLILGSLPADTDFARLAAVAAALIARDAVVQWIVSRHPLLVVDELQDLRAHELAVIKGLARGLHIFCAADHFQELDPQGPCEGVEWARSAGIVVTLDHVHRTQVTGLLAAAVAVRTGAPPAQGNGFTVLKAANSNVCAGHLARGLTWAAGVQVAVISPTRPASSPFVRDALARLAEGPIPKSAQRQFGPFVIPWDTSVEEDLARYETVLGLTNGGTVTATELLAKEHALPGPFADWVRTRRRLAGETLFPTSRIREQLGYAQALVRAHVPPRQISRMGLTIHQAKNREFECVIVLWPVQVPGDSEVQRRLLYNAITRARRHCTVIVQDPAPQNSRMARPPFA